MPIVSVSDPIDVLHAQGCVKRFAAELGFDRIACQELAIVASELASNIIKYGNNGQILAQSIVSEQGLCLELIATDCGPPFYDLTAAMNDGWDQNGPIDPSVLLKRRGIGGGLGAIVRFTHSFDVEDLPRGKQIITRRYLNNGQAQKPRGLPRGESGK